MLDEGDFIDLKIVLDNIMKERVAQNIGMTTKQASHIPYEVEQELWKQNILGEDTPDKLRDTVLFLLGINLGLRACDEHYDLRRESSVQPSQLTFERSENGKRCLVYREDTITKTNDGGLKCLKKDRKFVWVYPSEDVTKCPVRLVDKYISLLPPVGPKTLKKNFYLLSLEKPNLAQWYSVQPVGKHTLSKVVGKLLKNSKLDGFFSNHSLRRASTTRLFQAGVDRKIVKEFTGHRSDAIDKYQVTLNAQRETISKIIGRYELKVADEKTPKTDELNLEFRVKETKDNGELFCECSCRRQVVKSGSTKDIGEMIGNILHARKGAKATIRVEVEFS